MTSTIDVFGQHVWDASAACEEDCSGDTSYPYAHTTVTIGFDSGPCSVDDPVRTDYYGGTGNVRVNFFL
ncbi:MAG TPA: hypothetical protein VFB14_07895 [Bryobacteraceae bacterium]|nr:hypothetical protein [Bryobacteraceae bacterium]